MEPGALDLIQLSPSGFSGLASGLSKAKADGKLYAALVRRGLELGFARRRGRTARAVVEGGALDDLSILTRDPDRLVALIDAAPEHPFLEVALRSSKMLETVAESIDEVGQRTVGRALLRLAARQFKPYLVKDGELYLYCPHTKTLMVDPHISRSGDTYSKVAFEELDALRRPWPDRFARALLQKYPNGRVPLNREALEEFVSCPVSFEPMVEPRIDRFGHAYDLLSILRGTRKGTPPGTRLSGRGFHWRAPLAGSEYRSTESFRASGLLLQLICNTESLLDAVSARCVSHLVECCTHEGTKAVFRQAFTLQWVRRA